MATTQNPWNEALRLRTALAFLGVEEGEIAFPAPSAAGALCFVSEAINEAADITPTQAKALQATLQRFRVPLEGRSIRLEAGSVELYHGDSGEFLMPWWEDAQLKGACPAGSW
jgi:hypothetical protein